MTHSLADHPELEALAKPGSILLDKYRVEHVLGIGGMGAVVAAMHLQLEERVAIKFLLGPVAQNPDMVERFLREGRSAIKIRSEHCVRILDVGKLPQGSPYMVMEHLQGRDLDQLVAASGPLRVSDAIDYVLQAGEALAEAHVLGIIHRDLKPANLFVAQRADGSPCVKVLDFGISKQSNPGGGGDMSMTSTALILGSPLYMSPEQMRSTRNVDARTDIWALGTVLYEALTGQPPFQAESVTELCAKILQDEPPALESYRADIPQGLDAALRQALEKNRDRRYPSMAELAAALAPFGSQSAVTSAERIARVLHAKLTQSQRSLVAAVPAGRVDHGSQPNLPAPANNAIAHGSTLNMNAMSVSQGSLAGGAPRESRGRVLVGIGAGALAIVALASGIVLLRGRSGRSQDLVPPAAASVPTRPAETAPAAVPPPPPAVTATATTPSATIVAAPATPTLAAKPAANPATAAPKPKPTPAQKPAGKPKDMFDDRKD